MRSLGPSLLAVGALMLVGCVGSGVGVPVPEEGGTAKTFEDIQVNLFDFHCVPCHSGGGASRGLSLERGLSVRMLVDVPSNEAMDMLRVAPGRAADSYLIVKVVPMDSRRIGSRMPRLGPPFLTNAEIRGLRRWIDQGATDPWEDDGGDDPADDDDSAWQIEPANHQEPG